MIDTYKTYLAADRSLTLEEMEQLHGDMVSEMGNDPDALEPVSYTHLGIL